MLAIMIIDLNFIMRIIPVIVIPVVPVTFCSVAIGIHLLVGRAAAAKPPALRLQPVRRVIHMLGRQNRRPRAVLLPAVDQAAKAVYWYEYCSVVALFLFVAYCRTRRPSEA